MQTGLEDGLHARENGSAADEAYVGGLSVVKKVPVFGDDTEKIDSLSTEVENLKVIPPLIKNILVPPQPLGFRLIIMHMCYNVFVQIGLFHQYLSVHDSFRCFF